MPARKSGTEAAGNRRLHVARHAFAVNLPGEGTVIVQPGQVVEEGDPVYAGREDLFAPHETAIRNYPGRVEQATSAPGEKRS